MKTLLSLVLVFVTVSLNSTSVLAAKVGDSSTYGVIIAEEGGRTEKFVQVFTATAINAGADQITIHQETYKDGALINEIELNTSLSTMNAQEQIVEECRTDRVNVRVAAGEFKACRLQQGSAEIYFGSVFTGIIKGISAESGLTVTFELLKFTRN